MTPDLYGAWLEASNNLHTAVDWIGANWPWLVIAAVTALALWAIRRGLHGDDYRTRNDKRQAWLIVCDGGRPEAPEPGTNDDDLLVCLQILRATNNARKEKP